MLHCWACPRWGGQEDLLLHCWKLLRWRCLQGATSRLKNLYFHQNPLPDWFWLCVTIWLVWAKPCIWSCSVNSAQIRFWNVPYCRVYSPTLLLVNECLGCKTQQDPAGLASACASTKCWQMQNIFDIIPIRLADVGFGRSIVLALTQKQNLEDVIKVILCSYIVFYYPRLSATSRADFLTWQDPDFCSVQS